LNWYSPKPRQAPKRLPRQRPLKTIPSALGDEGIVGNWLFYYLKGGDHLHDFSPYGNHGTINGAVWKDGSYGWSLDFDGVDDYVEYPKDTVTDETNITVSAWFKIVDTSHNPVVAKRDSIHSVYGCYRIKVMTDDTPRWQVWDNQNNIIIDLNPSITIPHGEWKHGVGTFKQAESGTLYIDGSEVASGSTTTSLTWNETVRNTFGANVRDDVYLNGAVAIIRIYKEVKSSSWVSRRFARTKGIFGL